MRKMQALRGRPIAYVVVLLTCVSISLSCAGVTVRSKLQREYDWDKVEKIGVLNVEILEASREISRALAHSLFERGFGVVEGHVLSVVDIEQAVQTMDVDVVIYGHLSKVETHYYSGQFTAVFPTKTVEVELKSLVPGREGLILITQGSVTDSVSIKDAFLIQAAVDEMVGRLLGERRGES